MTLPGYDAWKLGAPRDTIGLCAECGIAVFPDDEALKVADGWACSTECQAMHNLRQAMHTLRQAKGPADVLAAAATAYGEGCEFVLRIVDPYGNEMLYDHLSRNRAGTYIAECMDAQHAVYPRTVERAEVVG